MEKLTVDVNRFLSNEMQIQQLKSENDILLQRTHQLETKMNRLKQHGKTPCKVDESMLNTLVSKSLYLLAQIHTLQTVGTMLVPQHSLQTMYRRRHNSYSSDLNKGYSTSVSNEIKNYNVCII